MPSITSWTRLEPLPRSVDMRQSLAARIHDPLWLLARQWQLGAFQGEDAGSPCRVELDANVSLLSRYLPKLAKDDHTNEAAVYTPVGNGAVPLETLVEREPGRASSDQRSAVEAGLHLLRLLGPDLAEKYRAALLKAFPVDAGRPDRLDATNARFCRVVAGRVIDGMKLRAMFAKPWPKDTEIALPGLPFPAIEPGDDEDAFKAALEAWLIWYDTLFSEPDRTFAWQINRLEYAFSVAAATGATSGPEAVLVAQEYPGGRMDWYSFDQDADAKHLLGAKDIPRQEHFSMSPAPMRFRGMPAARFWEFEDATIDLANLEAAREDLSRMLLMEFALVYGNDFFIIPIDLTVGSLCWISSLNVTNTFGETVAILSTRDSAAGAGIDSKWQMYGLSLSSNAGRTADFFFLPPVLGPMLESKPFEEVVFVRDEMANLVWAIEQTVQGYNGQPMNRAELFQRQRQRELDRRESEQPGSTAPAGGPLEYRLFTEAPDYWNPLNAVGAGLLKLGILNIPLGGLLQELADGAASHLHEEEIPRDGIHVARSHQYTRWTDGLTHLWIGRRKQPGRGETSSGLQFDVVSPDK
jgi:hypothetical protein